MKPSPEGSLADSESASASLVVLSTTCTAEELAQAVGLTADRSWRQGERKGTTSAAVHKYSGVEYDSLVDRSASPLLHLEDLLARLQPFAANVGALARRLSGQESREDPVRLWISCRTANGTPGLDLSPRHLEAVAALGAHLGITFLFDIEETLSGD